MKGELDCFNCKMGDSNSQIIHFNVYKRKQLKSMFWGQINSSMWEYLTLIKKLIVPRLQTAALIES